MLYNSIYITLLKLQNYRKREQISGCQSVGWEKRKASVVIEEKHKKALW